MFFHMQLYRCEMSDGSGVINLRSVGEPNQLSTTPVYEIPTGFWIYQYNPCYPFSSVGFTDLAVS